MKSKTKRIYFAVCLVELVCVVFSIVMLVRPLKEYNWQITELQFPQDRGTIMNSFVYCNLPGIYFDNSASDGQDSVSVTTPAVELAPGSYNIQISYSASDPTDTFSCNFYNVNRWNSYENTGNQLVAGQNAVEKTYISSITAMHDFYVQVDYNGDGYLYIANITIQETHSLVLRFLLYSLVIFTIISILLHIHANSDTQWKKTLLLLITLVFVSSIPLFEINLLDGDDLLYHLERIEALAEGIRCGQFPVRISPYWNNGYGYASSIFYNDLFLLLPALLRLLGISVRIAYKVYIISVNAMTAAICWYSYKNIFSRKTAYLGTILYMLLPYRLLCIYKRAAVGEYTAMAFLPLVIYGIYRIYHVDDENLQDHETWRDKLVVIMPAVLGFTGLICTHVISTFIVGILTLIFCIVQFRKTFSKKILTRLIETACVVLMLNAWFIIPLVDSMRNGIEAIENAQSWSMDSCSLTLLDLFNLMPDAKPLESKYAIGSGICPIFALFWIYTASTKNKLRNRKLGNICTGLGIFSLLCTTYLFPWDSIMGISSSIAKVIGNIQFSWRFLGAGGALLVVTTLCFAVNVFNDNIDYKNRDYVKIIIIMGTLIPVLSLYANLNNGDRVKYVGKNSLSSTYVATGEYLPVGSDVTIFSSTLPVSGDGVKVVEYNKENEYLNINVSNENDEESYVDIPFLYYPGYIGTDLQTNQKFICVRGNQARARILLPAGYSGTICVRYTERKMWRISELLTLSTLIIICFNLKRRRQHGCKLITNSK